jgi:glycosyltransferase involved in cell wall biosynthesis
MIIDFVHLYKPSAGGVYTVVSNTVNCSNNTFAHMVFSFKTPKCIQTPDVYVTFWGLVKILIKRDALAFHVHGFWRAECVLALIMSLLFNVKLIFSPHGMLENYSVVHKRYFLKKVWYYIFGLAMLSRAHTIFCCTDLERQNSFLLHRFRDKILILPLGVSFPVRGLTHFQRDTSPPITLAMFCRIDPKKNIEHILNVLVWLRNTNMAFYDACVFNVYGAINDEKYYRSLIKFCDDFSLSDKVNFCGFIAGDMKYKAFLNSNVVVVPSFEENFCLTAAEALVLSVPLVVSENVNLKEFFMAEDMARACNLDSLSEWGEVLMLFSERSAKMREDHSVHINQKAYRLFSWPAYVEKLEAVVKG